jgi:hypothetical protein
MDSLSALSVAGSILVVAEFRTDLLLTPKQSRGESLLKQREEYLSFVSEKFKPLILELSTGYNLTKEQISAGALQPSSDVVALQELALTCIGHIGKFVEDVEKIQRDFQGSESSQYSVDAKSWLASLLGGRVDEAKLERLSTIMTVHVRSIIRCARSQATTLQ